MLGKRITGYALAGALALALGAGGAAFAAGMPENVFPLESNASAEDIKERLLELGFTQVTIMQHAGNKTNFTGLWNGDQVTMTVDATTGGLSYMGGTTAIDTGGNMNDMEYVRNELRKLGYTDIGRITREGNVIETRAMMDGKRQDLAINAETGGITKVHTGDTAIITTAEQPMDEQYLETQLQRLGYSDVRNVDRKGRVYELEALKDGVWHKLRISGENGAVTIMN